MTPKRRVIAEILQKTPGVWYSIEEVAGITKIPRKNVRYALGALVTAGEIEGQGHTLLRRYRYSPPDADGAPPEKRPRGRPRGSLGKPKLPTMLPDPLPTAPAPGIDEAIRALTLHKAGYVEALEVAIQLLKGLRNDGTRKP